MYYEKYFAHNGNSFVYGYENGRFAFWRINPRNRTTGIQIKTGTKRLSHAKHIACFINSLNS